MVFNNLAFEVITLIGSYCAQADLVNLAIACPCIADAILPGLYRYIVIDTVPRHMCGVRATRWVVIDGKSFMVPVSVVNTIAGIKQLLESLGSSNKYTSQVRSLVVKGNLAISDNILIPMLHRALKNLDRLTELGWTASPEMPPELLSELCRDEQLKNTNITSLSVDLVTRPGQSYPAVQFPNIQKLSVRPFLDVNGLRWLKSILSASECVEDIRIFRFLDSKSDVRTRMSFVGLSDLQPKHELCPAVSAIFEGSPRKYRLRRLDLAQIDTCPHDAQNLDAAVDIRALEELTLIGSGLENEHSHRLLSSIVAKRPILLRATLNWNASFMVLNSFYKICCSELRELDVTIKETPRRILGSIQLYCPKLTQLKLQIHCDFTLADLKPLALLPNLVFVKLPFNYTVDSWVIASEIRNLKVLELKWINPLRVYNDNGLNSIRVTNMGLLTSGIMDQWNDRARSPLQCANIVDSMKAKESMDYVVIDGTVTPLKPNLAPLESYNWFPSE